MISPIFWDFWPLPPPCHPFLLDRLMEWHHLLADPPTLLSGWRHLWTAPNTLKRVLHWPSFVVWVLALVTLISALKEDVHEDRYRSACQMDDEEWCFCQKKMGETCFGLLEIIFCWRGKKRVVIVVVSFILSKKFLPPSTTSTLYISDEIGFISSCSTQTLFIKVYQEASQLC